MYENMQNLTLPKVFVSFVDIAGKTQLSRTSQSK